MSHDALHQQLRKPATAILVEDEHVGSVGMRGIVADRPGEAHLALPIIDPKRKASFDRLAHQTKGNSGRPIGLSKKAMHNLHVKPARIRTDRELRGTARSASHLAILLLLLLLAIAAAVGQVPENLFVPAPENAWAVVVGVSRYQALPKDKWLEYADADAD